NVRLDVQQGRAGRRPLIPLYSWIALRRRFRARPLPSGTAQDQAIPHVLSPETSASISASVCNGDGARRKRSVPRGVGAAADALMAMGERLLFRTTESGQCFGTSRAERAFWRHGDPCGPHACTKKRRAAT